MTKKPTKKKKYLLPTLVALLICFLIAFCLAELYIKLKVRNVNWHDPNTQFDAQLGWSTIPNQQIDHEWGVISSNSLGFRSAEIDQEKGHVIVLGDSVVFGHGVGDHETMPHHLDQLISDLNMQAHNLGVSGYGIGQSYLNLKRHISKFNNLKYVVFVIFTYNDLRNTLSNANYGKRKPLFILENGRIIAVPGRIKKYNLRNVLSMSNLLNALSNNNDSRGNLLNKLAGDRFLDPKENGHVISTLLYNMRDLVEDRGAKFIVVLSPSTYDFIQKEEDHIWFETFFKKNGSDFQYINYFDHLLAYIGNLESLYKDWGHYKNKGNQLLAETVYKFIQKDLK